MSDSYGNEAVLTNASLPNGIRDVFHGGDECGKPVLVDRDHRNRKYGLFGSEALVGGDQGSEALCVGTCEELVVAEFIPIAEDCGLDGHAAKCILEGPSQAM